MKNAFTLAEVLITLAIIGVVAAMTMPTLIQNHQKKSLEVATKKFCSMMSQAVKQYMADEGVDDLRNTPMTDMDITGDSKKAAQEATENFVRKYLKVVKECGKDEVCFANSYKTQKNEESAIGFGSWYGYKDFITADGMVIEIIAADSDTPFLLYVDVNGKKGPNKIGYDLWSMDIFYDGSIDEGGATPECKKGIPNESGILCGGEERNSPAVVRQHRFYSCQGRGDGTQGGGYGGCFGHFMENGFKFDY